MIKLTTLFTSVLAASFCLAVFPQTLKAGTISSTVLELNGSTTQGDGQNQQLSTTFPARLTDTTGFDFSSNFSSLTAITYIQITLTLQDANSNQGGFDFNHLFLGLDGVNTGLALNGFPGNGLEATLTISGFVDQVTGAAIFTNLQDGFLVGSIITDNAMDSVISPNDLFVGNDALNATTTLVLGDAAVPEPATYILVGVGILLILAPRLRRFRSGHAA
ncbi:MAG: PEP-CTERM sorting domain-containing protein [Chthoniobacterales bacterium]